MTDLRKLSNEEFVDAFQKFIGEQMVSLQTTGKFQGNRAYWDEYRRRLSLAETAPVAEGDGYDRSKVSPTPWEKRRDEECDRSDIFDANNHIIGTFEDGLMIEADEDHALHCVNSHDRLASLVKRLGEALKTILETKTVVEHSCGGACECIVCHKLAYDDFTPVEGHCTHLECPTVIFQALIAEAGVGDEKQGGE